MQISDGVSSPYMLCISLNAVKKGGGGGGGKSSNFCQALSDTGSVSCSNITSYSNQTPLSKSEG